LFLLFAHAVAKALIFMSVGCAILTANNQDVRQFGGLAKSMPATTTAYIVGALTMTGVFPFGGFWAFQEGFEDLWVDYPWMVVTMLVVNGLTAFNLMRVYGLVFLGKTQPKTKRAPEVLWPLAVPMVFLSIFAVLTPIFMSQLALLPELDDISLLQISTISGSSLVGFVAGGYLYARRDRIPLVATLPGLENLLTRGFHIEKIYEQTVVCAVLISSQIVAWIDRYVVDGLVNFVGFVTIFSSEGLKYGTSGQMQSYALTIAIGAGGLGLMVAWLF
jgi:NAD(P)H-quinone oxidoreductase subunit 5